MGVRKMDNPPPRGLENGLDVVEEVVRYLDDYLAAHTSATIYRSTGTLGIDAGAMQVGKALSLLVDAPETVREFVADDLVPAVDRLEVSRHNAGSRRTTWRIERTAD
jgi:hypothetical protein